jgi:hypothetical protein
MADFATRLEGTGEYVDSQALSPEGTFVRYDGEGRPPVTDGRFAETKDLIAGWMVIDVDTYERALALAGELSAAPVAGGKPIRKRTGESRRRASYSTTMSLPDTDTVPRPRGQTFVSILNVVPSPGIFAKICWGPRTIRPFSTS